jgi:hypothetical protein
MPDEKYIVFNRDEFTRAAAAGVEHEVHPIDDAVVIRTQDAFATGGLWAYAHNIRTVMELRVLDPEEVQQCEAVAQYFASRAMEAQAILETGKAKVPD